MRKHKNRGDAVAYRHGEQLAYEMDSSLLDLLCEDGFLSPAELPDEDSPAVRLALLRRAIRRGFLLDGWEDEAAHLLIVKHLDSLRIWTDLTDEDVHLRAPPLCA